MRGSRARWTSQPRRVGCAFEITGRTPARNRTTRLFLEPPDLALVRGERPDYGDGDDDDRHTPDRVPRQPRERGDPADDRHDHADRPRPHRAGEHAEPGE